MITKQYVELLISTVGNYTDSQVACCYHVWLPLKVKAIHLNKTLYQVKVDLFRDYLRAELKNPRVLVLQPA